jgi:hypothetical protein
MAVAAGRVNALMRKIDTDLTKAKGVKDEE